MLRKLSFLLAIALLVMIAGCGKPSAEKGGKKLVVGFSQVGAESEWRLCETKSVKSEAAKRGIDLRFSDGGNKQAEQVMALRNFIAQRVDAILLAPQVETGWDGVLREAKEKGIPVILLDRGIDTTDESLYTTLISVDFIEEGRTAAQWMGEAMKGKGNVVELQGTPGSAPAIDRKKGFEIGLKAFPGMKILDSQSGDFRRTNGKEVMDAFLKKHKGNIDAVYAHNDDMAIGAIQAIEAAGKKPGKDIVIVSIDGLSAALEAIVAGKQNCAIECSPWLGPPAFDSIEKVIANVAAGKDATDGIPKKQIYAGRTFTTDNAKAALDSMRTE